MTECRPSPPRSSHAHLFEPGLSNSSILAKISAIEFTSGIPKDVYLRAVPFVRDVQQILLIWSSSEDGFPLLYHSSQHNDCSTECVSMGCTIQRLVSSAWMFIECQKLGQSTVKIQQPICPLPWFCWGTLQVWPTWCCDSDVHAHASNTWPLVAVSARSIIICCAFHKVSNTITCSPL